MKWTHLHQVTSLWAIKQENYPLLFESILGVNVSKFPAVKSKGLYSIAIHFITYLLGIPPKDSSVFQPFFSLRIRWDDPSRFLFQSRNGRCFHQICRARMFMTSLTLTNSQGTLAFFGEWWGPEKNGPGSIGGYYLKGDALLQGPKYFGYACIKFPGRTTTGWFLNYAPVNWHGWFSMAMFVTVTGGYPFSKDTPSRHPFV